MTRPSSGICYARTHADQQVRCAVCRLVWDIDDPHVPDCPRAVKAAPPRQQGWVEGFVSGLPSRS